MYENIYNICTKCIQYIQDIEDACGGPSPHPVVFAFSVHPYTKEKHQHLQKKRQQYDNK